MPRSKSKAKRRKHQIKVRYLRRMKRKKLAKKLGITVEELLAQENPQ